MSDLLTTRQMQELLQVDRVTIYRMLNDGRLKGVKIGNHWRFPREELDRLLGANPKPSENLSQPDPVSDFPISCVQKVQEIFAGILGVSALIVSSNGMKLTEIDYPQPFCQLILSSPEGCEGCKSSWRKMALRTTGAPVFMECHAGLRYIKAPIHFGESKQPNAWLIAGQFYLSVQDPEIENRRLEDLAHKYKISLRDLRSAAKKIPVLKQAQQLQVQIWVPKVASTIESILCERSDLMARLQRIAELSSISPLLTEHT